MRPVDVSAWRGKERRGVRASAVGWVWAVLGAATATVLFVLFPDDGAPIMWTFAGAAVMAGLAGLVVTARRRHRA